MCGRIYVIIILKIDFILRLKKEGKVEHLHRNQIINLIKNGDRVENLRWCKRKKLR